MKVRIHGRRRPLLAFVNFGQLGALLCAIGLTFGVVSPGPIGPDAARGGDAQSVELPDLRTQTSKTFRNADGTRTTALYANAVHYRDDGKWVDIDSTLVPSNAGGYALTNRANSFHAQFKDSLADDYLRIDTGGESFAFTAVGAARGAVRADGARAAYGGAFDGVDLRYDVVADGVKETLVLASSHVPTHYRFTLRATGADGLVQLDEQADGSYAVLGAESDLPLFELAAPVVRDATGVTAADVVSMKATKEGDAYAIDIDLDARWLHSGDREFPVELDPTITITPPVQNGTIEASCTTCAVSKNAGVRLQTGSNSTQIFRAGLLFDVGAIPVGANISDAQLKLYYDRTCVSGTTSCTTIAHQVDVHAMTNFWTTATQSQYIRYDSSAPLASASLPSGAAAQWLSWNLTKTLGAWRNENQPNFGVLVKRSADAVNSGGPTFASATYADATLQPRLEVTYVDDGLELRAPDTLHSNGAVLSWTPYKDPGGAPFKSYEIHRSRTAGFTPSASTLIATLADPNATTYTDTTAAAGATFTYQVVVNGTAQSAQRTVTLPADGRATKTIKSWKQTYIVRQTSGPSCGNYGSVAYHKLGLDASYLRRDLLEFDLRDIPTTASVTAAELKMFHRDAIPAAMGTASAHRVTSEWTEGTSGSGSCTGDGATWFETIDGVPWVTAGGDFDAATEGQPVTLTAGEEPAWHTYTLTSLVQRWLNGQVPNLGVLLKLDDETTTGTRVFTYVSDDYTVAPTQQPTLSVTYADASHANPPNVAISQPGGGDTLSGSGSSFGVSASDDGRVVKVEYVLDGALVGTATSSPFSLPWNATSVSNGNHTLTATAEDDAGNRTTSASVTFKVDNTAPPTGAVTSPAPYAAVVKSDAPIAYWRMGEKSGTTLVDDMGSFNGTYGGGFALGKKAGIVNESDTSASFDGVSGYANVANVNPNNVLSSTTKATLEGWVLPPDRPATYTGYFGIKNSVNADFYVIQLPNSNTLEIRYTQSGGTSYTINATIVPNVWHYIAVTLSPVTQTIVAYIDGQQVAQGTAYGKLGDVAVPLEIGRLAGGSWAVGRVQVDEVALYNKTLSVARIQAHYAAGAPVAQADNPLAYWRLGEASGTTAYDTQGRYNGTYAGGVTLGSTGAIVNDTSTAAAFNGVDGYVNVANVNDAAIGSLAVAGKYSLEGWVIPPSVPTSHSGYFGLRNDSNADFYVLQLVNTNQLECRFRNSAGTAYTITTAAIQPGAWHHVALTYDGATLTCLVDGQPYGSTPATGVLANVALPLTIGRTNYSWSSTNGRIDDVALYAKALTWAQAQAHYNARKQIVGSQARATSTLTATASDDVGVTKVEFYVDDNRVGETTQSPYAVDWNTLDPGLMSYDGPHTITTKTYDTSGQVTTSAPVTLSVANAPPGSPYVAGYSSTTVPQSMTWDPNGGATQDNAGVDVTVANKSSVTWSSANVVMRYRWISSDASPSYTDGGDVAFTANVAPGASQTLRAIVPPPALPAGVDRAQYTLRFDLFDKAGNTWFADKGSAPLDNPVIVNKALVRDALGLERYYHYTGLEAGAGMSQLTNVANGNSILRWTPFDESGIGLATVMDLTYNALEQKCECPAGNNWSLSISSLTRFGNPIDVHPNKADTIAGNARKFVEFNDGDGTTIRFTDSNNDGYWEAPPGVHLYLRPTGSADPARYWAMSRPDRTTFYYNQDGFPTSVVDNDGNTLTFTLTAVAPADDPGGPRYHITSVKDAGGRTFDITYYTKADAKKPQIRGKVKQITDHLNHALVFDYYEDGNLLRITQKGGTNPDGSTLADRTFVFTYTTSDGSGPAIPAATDRVNPNPRTPNQSTRIYSVRDPRGAETRFAYLGPGYGTDRWKLASVTDRAGNTTSFSYDTVARVTTVTEPLSRVSKYAYDTEGKVTQITNPLDQSTTVDWTGDRAIAKVTEPSGAYTRYTYNDNGYLTDEYVLQDRKDPATTSDDVVARTQLTYENIAVDANDVAAKWETGRTIPHYSQLQTKTDPKGTATATPTNDYQWTFAYNGNGDLVSVTDPLNNKETYDYNANGTLSAETDANLHKTTYPSYDANGLPTKIVDGLGNADPTNAAKHTTTFEYDAAGNLRWVQDELHQTPAAGLDVRQYRSWFDYDPFGRLVRQSTPKSTSLEPTKVIWSDAAYDPNDNVVSIYDPHFGTFDSDPKQNVVPQTTTYDAMDRVTADVESHDPASTDAAQKSHRTEYAYDAAGRLVKVTDPKGTLTTTIDKDYATFYGYDLVDRVTSQTSYQVDSAGNVTQTQTAYACFDLAGDLRSSTAPKNATETDPTKKFSACPAATTPYTPTAASYTTKFTYNDAHELLSETDPEGHVQSVTYDLNGDVDTMTDESSVVGKRVYNQRGELVKEIEPFRNVTGGTRDIVKVYEYDPVGNLKREISERAYDATSDPNKQSFSDYVTSYEYDADDQLIREVLPTSASDTEQLYVHHHYDEGGNLDWTSETTAQGDVNLVPVTDKSTFTYFDTGLVRTSKDPAQPQVTFDYDARGNQVARTPEGDPAESWTYFDDDLLKEEKDPTGDPETYVYDANGNLTTVDDTNGVTRPNEQPIHVEQTYDQLDRLTKIRQQKLGAPWHFTTYGYDLNDNVVTEEDDATEGTTPVAGRKVDWSYDTADWVTQQIDRGTDAGCSDDQRIDYTFFATGTQKDQLVWKAGAGCTATAPNWTLRQQTSRDYFLDGSLKTQKTWNGASSTAQLVQSHTLSYETAGIYLNGNIATDTFTVSSPDSGAPCQSTACTTTYTYDAKDRLIKWDNGRGGLTDYTLDPHGNVATETSNGVKRTFTYENGDQLTKIESTKANTLPRRFWYTHGNLVCETQDESSTVLSSRADCPDPQSTAVSSRLRATYDYDTLDRITAFHAYAKNATTGAIENTDSSGYTYDAFDRVSTETETHNGAARSTAFDFVDVSDDVAKETRTGDQATTKAYSYDAFDDKVGMTDSATNGNLLYGYNARGDVEQLLDAVGQAKATYGYKAYGEDEGNGANGLSRNDSDKSPLNPYRYAAQRFDSGSGSIDMGARRFSPDLTRFLQNDFYRDALDDLDLAFDPLTGNRYGYSGGNPINFVEIDGHFGLPHFVKKAIHKVSHVAKAAWHGVKKVGKYCLGDGAATCSMVAAGVALTATGVGAAAGGGMIATAAAATATTASVASRGLGAYATARSVRHDIKHRNYAGLALTAATLGRGRGAAQSAERSVARRAPLPHVPGGRPSPRVNAVSNDGFYNRARDYGKRTTRNPVAERIRRNAEGTKCPECGATMKRGGPNAPTAQHDPPLMKHRYREGRNMSQSEREAYGESERSMNGALCRRCQSREGQRLSRLHRRYKRFVQSVRRHHDGR